jgi:hypothetical protein
MLKAGLKCLLALELLIAASQACVLPAAPTVSALDPNAIKTAIAGTQAAAWTQTARVAGPATLTPTITRTKILSPTPFPTFTVAVVMPTVYVTKNTHCRTGPGEAYESVGVLKTGETAQAVGRSKDAKYWIIRNPSRPKQVCWLSAKYATVVGAAGALHVFTAPPPPTATNTRKPPTRTPVPTAIPATPGPTNTPAPNFTAAYAGSTDTCTGTDYWADISLVNTSPYTFQSIFIVMYDVTDGTGPFSVAGDDFINSNGCAADVVDTLPGGATLIVSSPVLPTPLTGHELLLNISLCTGTSQTGSCVIQGIDFTP